MDTSVDSEKTAVRAYVAFALYAFSNWMLTCKVFPVATDAAVFCRDVGTLVQGLGLLLVAVVATRAPRLLPRALFVAAPLACTAVGLPLVALGGASGSAWVATLGVCLTELTSVSVVVALGCTLMRAGLRCAAPAVLVGLTLSYLLRFPLDGLSGVPALALFGAMQAGLVLLCRPSALDVLRRTQAGASPAELALANPFSFLPLNHQLYSCLLVFQLAYGFALSFGEVNATPLATFAGVVPLLALCAWFAVRRRLPGSDALFGIALLTAVAGFLFVPLSRELAVPLTGNLLEAGSSCFSLVFWLCATALALRNETGALPLFAWGGSVLSVGVVAGAFAGRIVDALLASSPVASSVAISVIVLVLVAYALFALKGFSFAETIAGVAAASPAAEPPAPEPSDAQVSETADALRRLADEAGLTPREAEVFGLLAEGRNGVVVQERLGVSYNTVKTHVAHIYTKLGVHTHQELLDLVRKKG